MELRVLRYFLAVAREESILKDCGCAKEIIASCLQIKEKYGEQEILPVLQQERYRLLQKIHGEQQKLDILDYVIFKLKQGGLKDV